MIKAVIFDLDGTLLESESAWRQSAIRLLCHLDITLPEYILEKCEHTWFRGQLRMLLEDPAIDLGMNFDECVAWCISDIGRLYATTLQLKPGARELLAQLKAAGVPVALATASDEGWVLPALNRLGVLDQFDEIFCALREGIDLTKSDTALYDRIAAKLGVTREECLLVDDSLYALVGARNAGVAAWGIEERTRKDEREEIKAASDVYFADLFQLSDALMAEIEKVSA